MLDNILCKNNNKNKELESGIPATSEEALAHGEKFLKWLATYMLQSLFNNQTPTNAVQVPAGQFSAEKQKRTTSGCKQSRKRENKILWLCMACSRVLVSLAGPPRWRMKHTPRSRPVQREIKNPTVLSLIISRTSS